MKKESRNGRVTQLRMRPCRDARLTRMRRCVHACAWPRVVEKEEPHALVARTTGARCARLQKVHCIYKSFIMNYTMVYLKWEACLVRGYMGYRDYNACGREKPGLQRGWDTRNRTLSCRCSRVRTQHDHASVRSVNRPRHACTRLQIGSA